VMGRGRGGWER